MRSAAFEPLLSALRKEGIKTGTDKINLGMVTLLLARNEDAILAAARAEVDDEWPRWILWEACPHEGKYGDDGEMQCTGADFKRDQVWMLQQHVQQAYADKNADLTTLRGERIDLAVRLADAQAGLDADAKRIQVLEDLLQDIYRGKLGYENPRDPEIVKIRKELDLV